MKQLKNAFPTSQAIYNTEDIFAVTHDLVFDLKQKALTSPRKRFRFCMHKSTTDKTHEMVIVFHRDTFMPPHRHPKGKSESYHIIEGHMRVYFFNDTGAVIRTIDLQPAGKKGAFLYRLSANIWHMPVPLSEWLIYHETYTGPFTKMDDVEFPPWAPQENDAVGVKKFLANLNAGNKT